VSGVELLVAEIERADLDNLRELWRRRYGPPPPLRSVPLLRSLLAWRVQAEALGGLDAETKRALVRKGRVRAEGLHLGLGACLTREWQGRTYKVVVEADGFRLDGRLYRSLSAAATAIAGSRWNGPRFFGLRDAA
jgi:hypothetical protein